MEDAEKLKQASEALQARLRDETRLRADLERRCHILEKLAHRDPSTGLRTETYLRSRVQEEIQRSIRYPSAMTLVTLCAPQDCCHLLPQLGNRLSSELRASDHVFGLSNMGLAILLVETPQEGAERALERLTAELEQFIRGYGHTVTSFPVDTNLADEFFKMAMDRHNDVVKNMQPNGPGVTASSPSVH